MNIESLASALSGIQSVGSTTSTKEGSSSFSSLLTDALKNVEDTESANQESTVALLTGADESIDSAMIQAEESKLALSLAIQVRNKVLDSYKEIMQMQV